MNEHEPLLDVVNVVLFWGACMVIGAVAAIWYQFLT